MAPRAAAAPPATTATPRPKALAPTFTAPQGSATAVLARPAPAIVSAVAPPAPRSSPYVGTALSPSEIQTLMQHAGNGCPLGPCKGCPHYEITTGACTA